MGQQALFHHAAGAGIETESLPGLETGLQPQRNAQVTEILLRIIPHSGRGLFESTAQGSPVQTARQTQVWSHFPGEGNAHPNGSAVMSLVGGSLVRGKHLQQRFGVLLLAVSVGTSTVETLRTAEAEALGLLGRLLAAEPVGTDAETFPRRSRQTVEFALQSFNDTIIEKAWYLIDNQFRCFHGRSGRSGKVASLFFKEFDRCRFRQQGTAGDDGERRRLGAGCIDNRHCSRDSLFGC